MLCKLVAVDNQHQVRLIILWRQPFGLCSIVGGARDYQGEEEEEEEPRRRLMPAAPHILSPHDTQVL